jgi:Protein of unknown function (DUF3179)
VKAVPEAAYSGSDIPVCTIPGADVWAPDKVDWCTPLDEPMWVAAADATLMRDDDTVLGFEAAGRIWAIPWWVMKNHHVANLTLEEQPFLVTLCEFCVAGGVFDPVADGRLLHFRVTGWYRGSPLMVDDNTGSLWALVNAQPLQGEATSIGRLPKRPIVHATWAEWRAMYPETRVVHGIGEPRDGHGAKHSAPDHSKSSVKARDRRLGALDLVVGLELGAGRAYPLTSLHGVGGIVDDVFEGRPIVVVTRPRSWLAVAFEAQLDGEPVGLAWDDRENGQPILVDARTGSRFDLWGLGVTGKWEGRRLPYVLSALKKWAVWAGMYPETELWEPASSAR